MAATSMTSQRLVLLTFPPDGDGKTCDVPLASANMSLSGESWSGEPGLEGIIVERLLLGRTPNEPVMPVLWWVSAVVASAAGLITERGGTS